jgi:hypothetical protein
MDPFLQQAPRMIPPRPMESGLAMVYEQQAAVLIEEIHHLREPYRGNTISWLERCTNRSFKDPDHDLLDYLDSLHPIVRDSFVCQVSELVSDALRYFGMPTPSG